MKLVAASILLLVGLVGATSVPRITYDELKRIPEEASLLEQIKDDGGRLGAFAVTGIPLDGYKDDVTAIMNKAKNCIGNDESLSKIELSGHSTRRTYATVDNTYPECFMQEADTVSRAFQLVSHGVFGAIETVSGRVLGYVSGGSELALSEAPHKDHIHFYARSEDESSDDDDSGARALVPEHIDNGLFLLITPFPGQSLVVRTSTGRLVSTDDLDVSDTVLVLPGAALPDWLLQGESKDVRDKFHPVPHMVPHLQREAYQRTVFARMMVAPSDAIPTRVKNPHPVTFEEVFMRQNRLEEGAKTSLESGGLCSVDLDSERYIRSVRDQCNDGTTYCWMGCNSNPPHCSDDNAVCYDAVAGEECDPDSPDHNTNCVVTCPFECPEPNGYFADPEFCCTFYDCSNSIPTRMECTTPEGPLLYYNEVGKYCDWPENTDCGRRRGCCPTLLGIDTCWY